jgi:hypothetical protein
MAYSPDPRVEKAVAKLLDSMEQVNPYTRRAGTIAEILDLIRERPRDRSRSRCTDQCLSPLNSITRSR